MGKCFKNISACLPARYASKTRPAAWAAMRSSKNQINCADDLDQQAAEKAGHKVWNMATSALLTQTSVITGTILPIFHPSFPKNARDGLSAAGRESARMSVLPAIRAYFFRPRRRLRWLAKPGLPVGLSGKETTV